MPHEIDDGTEPWGVKVELVQMKSVEIPPSMRRAMAQAADALREKRARLINAEAELDAAEQRAAAVIIQNPSGLELRLHADRPRGRRRTEHHDHRHDA